MWIMVIVMIYRELPVYLHSLPNTKSFPSEQACEAALTESFKTNEFSSAELVRGQMSEQLLLQIELGNGVKGYRGCVESRPME